MTSHEAIVEAFPYGEEGKAGLNVVCECGIALLEELADGFMPVWEINDAVRRHQEREN